MSYLVNICYSVDYKYNIKQYKIRVCIPYPLQRESAKRCQTTPFFVLEHLCASSGSVVNSSGEVKKIMQK